MRVLLLIAVMSCVSCAPSLGQETADKSEPSQAEMEGLSDIVAQINESSAHLQEDHICRGPEARQVTHDQFEIFGALTDLVGTRLRGAPTDGSTERAADIQQWEWALGGTAILIRHALEDGSYGGDTYVYKDAASGELVYVYITNAGFRTEGVMRVNEDGSFTAEEDVSGHESITKVRSTSMINGDGSTSMSSEYLSNGEWVPGHAFTYVPTEKPLPVLTPKTPEAE